MQDQKMMNILQTCNEHINKGCWSWIQSFSNRDQAIAFVRKSKKIAIIVNLMNPITENDSHDWREKGEFVNTAIINIFSDDLSYLSFLFLRQGDTNHLIALNSLFRHH